MTMMSRPGEAGSKVPPTVVSPLPQERGRGVRFPSDIQHLAHLLQELPRGKGLLEEVLLRLEHAVVGDRVLGVARDEKHPHLRTPGHEQIGELAAAHAWHHHVGDQDVDGSRMPLGEGEGLDRRRRRRAPGSPGSPGSPSRARGCCPRPPPAAPPRSRPPGRWAVARRGGLSAGSAARGRKTVKREPRPGSLSTRIWPPLWWTMPCDGGQPQAGALAALLGGEERLEEAGPCISGAHAGAGVGHRELDVGARRQAGAVRGGWISVVLGGDP